MGRSRRDVITTPLCPSSPLVTSWWMAIERAYVNEVDVRREQRRRACGFARDPRSPRRGLDEVGHHVRASSFVQPSTIAPINVGESGDHVLERENRQRCEQNALPGHRTRRERSERPAWCRAATLAGSTSRGRSPRPPDDGPDGSVLIVEGIASDRGFVSIRPKRTDHDGTGRRSRSAPIPRTQPRAYRNVMPTAARVTTRYRAACRTLRA